MKVTLLVGLPGSGKTTLGKELEAQGATFIDDISIVGLKPLREAMKQVEYVVVADTFLCRLQEREAARRHLYDCEVEWVFFENAPEKCLRNVDKRADGRKVTELVKRLSEEYVIPQGVTPRMIHQ